MPVTLSIVVRRLPGSGPELIRMRMDASDGTYEGRVDLRCPAEQVSALGRGLEDFPGKVPDLYEFQFGEETENLTVRAVTKNHAGHTALQLKLAASGTACWLSVAVEAAAINRLGKLFGELGEGTNGGFRWTPAEAEAFPSVT